jgi:hypothetical protein
MSFLKLVIAFSILLIHVPFQGFYIEVMGEHMNCLDMSQYGTLLIVDPEEEFFAEEVEFSAFADVFTFLPIN